MPKRAISLRVASLQNAFVREANDIHIFINQALPLLEEARTPFENSTHKSDRTYYVPSVKKGKSAKRTDKELKSIYNRFTNHGLYETFFVSLVSKFEAFVGEVMKEILIEYPQKVGITVQGLKPTKEISTDILWRSADLSAVVEQTVEWHINKVFFAAPSVQFAYLAEIAGTEIGDESFHKYYELKATRDLLVHNLGVANEQYKNKAGRHARAEIGKKVAVDRVYFEESLALVKRLSGIIKRDAGIKFPHLKNKSNNSSQNDAEKAGASA